MNTEESWLGNNGGDKSTDLVPQDQAQNIVANENLVNTGSENKNFTFKKILIVIGCIVLGVILLVVVVFLLLSANSKKLECSYSGGNITILYSDDTINGYMANNMSYDLDEQKAYAELIGVEAYLEEFNDFFEANTDGTCIRK